MADDKSPLTKALRESADIIAPVIDEGTVLRIGVPVDNSDGSTTYRYTALYTRDRWYLTGKGTLLEREYASTIALLTALARYRDATIEIAIGFESIR